jgi:hypothetical protein
MIAAGIIGGLSAAIFGLAVWLAIHSGTRAQRIGLWHGAGNVVVVLLFVVSWFLRRLAPASPPPAAFVSEDDDRSAFGRCRRQHRSTSRPSRRPREARLASRDCRFYAARNRPRSGFRSENGNQARVRDVGAISRKVSARRNHRRRQPLAGECIVKHSSK